MTAFEGPASAAIDASPRAVQSAFEPTAGTNGDAMMQNIADVTEASVSAAIAAETSDEAPPSAETLSAATREVIERVVWEVVPELAETLIREEISRLLAEQQRQR